MILMLGFLAACLEYHLLSCSGIIIPLFEKRLVLKSRWLFI